MRRTIVSYRSAVHRWTGHEENQRLVERKTRARNGSFQGQTIAFFGDPGVRGELFEEVKQSAPVCAFMCEPMDTTAFSFEEKATIDREEREGVRKRKKEKTRERKRKNNQCGRPCLLRDSARDIPRLPYLHICGPWLAHAKCFQLLTVENCLHTFTYGMRRFFGLLHRCCPRGQACAIACSR